MAPVCAVTSHPFSQHARLPASRKHLRRSYPPDPVVNHLPLLADQTHHTTWLPVLRNRRLVDPEPADATLPPQHPGKAAVTAVGAESTNGSGSGSVWYGRRAPRGGIRRFRYLATIRSRTRLQQWQWGYSIFVAPRAAHPSPGCGDQRVLCADDRARWLTWHDCLGQPGQLLSRCGLVGIRRLRRGFAACWRLRGFVPRIRNETLGSLASGLE